MGMVEKIRIGALISGGGTNLQAIIDACEEGRIDGEMTFVGSDQSGVKGLARASKHGIAVSLRITGRSSNPIGRIRPTSPA
jgi:folate-dependent phosphoribosylglycinamide formyltransferase PurN